MFFQESESIVREHPDLFQVVQQVDIQLSGISSQAPLRPADFSSVLGAEENQVVSVLELLAQKGVLLTEEMVECERCHNLMSADAFRQAIKDEDEFECTGCSHPFRWRSELIVVYRMTGPAMARPRPDAPEAKSEMASGDEPLSERAQFVLVAMLELGSIDSDSRSSTDEIVVKAFGDQANPNSVKNVMSNLSTRRLIDTKIGRRGGCWLTEKGCLRAAKLRNRFGTVCAPINSG